MKRYLKFGDVYVHATKYYPQDNSSTVLLVIDDWIGDLNKVTSNRYSFAPGKRVIILPFETYYKAELINQEMFNVALRVELDSYSDKVTESAFNIYFKRTKDRDEYFKTRYYT